MDFFEDYEKLVKANEPKPEVKEDTELFKVEEELPEVTPIKTEEPKEIKPEPVQPLFNEDELIEKITNRILEAMKPKEGEGTNGYCKPDLSVGQ